MQNEIKKYQGDSGQLRYIRDRYNVLLTRKEGLEAAITHAKYIGADLKLLADTQKELIELDEKRTQLVNPKNFYPDVTDMVLVSKKKEKRVPVFAPLRDRADEQPNKGIQRKKYQRDSTPLNIIEMKIKTGMKLNRWEYQTAVNHSLIEPKATATT